MSLTCLESSGSDLPFVMNVVLLLLVIPPGYPCYMWKDGPQRWYVKSFLVQFSLSL